MANTSITAWVAQEEETYDNFHEYVASRTEGCIFRALAEKMRRDLKKGTSSSVTFPWGTYSVEVKNSGDTGNITPVFEPSEAFLKMLNAPADQSRVEMVQTQFDPEYTKLFNDMLSYGMFDPELPENKEKAAKNKSIRFTEEIYVYNMNSYARMLAAVAREKQRDGKTYRLEINASFPHGSFDFEYIDDEIRVKFIPSKIFKQYLKDDDLAMKAQDADFEALTEVKVEKIPVKAESAAAQVGKAAKRANSWEHMMASEADMSMVPALIKLKLKK